MSRKTVKLRDILVRSKIPVDIEDNVQYKRVTIKTKHQGVSIRDYEIGSNIGTKKQFILKAGQFVLSKIDAMYGAFGIAHDEVDGAIITGNFWAYDYNRSKVSIEWLNHFTNSPIFYELCRRASKGITHRKYLDEDFFLSYEVQLPDLIEQEDIVESIDSIRNKISSLDNELSHQLTLLENLNQAILQEAVQGKLVPQDPKDEPAGELLKRIKAEKATLRQAQGSKKVKELPSIKPEEIPFQIPDNWVWCRLGDLRDFKFTLSYGVLVPGNEIPEGIPFVRVQDLDFADNGKPPSKRISPLIEKKFAKTRLVGGEILICVVGSIGKVALSPDNWIGANIARAVCRFMPNSSIDRKYIYYCLISPFIQNFFLDSQKSINPTLNVNILETTLIPLPPLSEQQRIVAEIEKQLEKTQELKAHIISNRQATEQLLKALLQGAFEGEEKEN